MIEINKDLIEKLLQAGIDSVLDSGHGFEEPQYYKEDGREEILKILEAAQEISVTRGEVVKFAAEMTNKTFSERADMLQDFFKLKGIPTKEDL